MPKKRTPLTEEQVKFIERNYARKGPRWIGKKLGIDDKYIAKFANRRGLFLGFVDGYVPASYVAAELGLDNRWGGYIRQKAEKDGALRMLGNGCRAVVKEKWAKEYIENAKRRFEFEEAAEEGAYIGTEKAAKILGIPKWTLNQFLTKERISVLLNKYASGLRIYRGKSKLLFSAHQVEEIARRIRADEYKGRSLVCLRQLWDEFPDLVNAKDRKNWVSRTVNQYGFERIQLPYKGLMCDYIKPEDAEVVRQRLRGLREKGKLPQGVVALKQISSEIPVTHRVASHWAHKLCSPFKIAPHHKLFLTPEDAEVLRAFLLKKVGMDDIQRRETEEVKGDNEGEEQVQCLPEGRSNHRWHHLRQQERSHKVHRPQANASHGTD